MMVVVVVVAEFHNKNFSFFSFFAECKCKWKFSFCFFRYVWIVTNAFSNWNQSLIIIFIYGNHCELGFFSNESFVLIIFTCCWSIGLFCLVGWLVGWLVKIIIVCLNWFNEVFFVFCFFGWTKLSMRKLFVCQSNGFCFHHFFLFTCHTCSFWHPIFRLTKYFVVLVCDLTKSWNWTTIIIMLYWSNLI